MYIKISKVLILSLLICIIFIIGVIPNVDAGDIKGTISTKKLKSPEGIVVYIENVEGKEFPPPTEPAKMDQVNLVFVPRMLPVLKGTVVEFHNSDDLKHNVFGVGVEDFDLGTWGQGITKAYTFNKLGDTAILCNVHPEMEAYIIVLQNPYFTLTDKDGNYNIANVPAGDYKLKIWHDRLKPKSEDVQVTETGSATVDFTS